MTLALFPRSQRYFEMPKYGISALSLELVDGFWLNLERYIVGRVGILDQILMTLILHVF